LNRNGGSIFCFDAFSSREPASTSLENALAAEALQVDGLKLTSIGARLEAQGCDLMAVQILVARCRQFHLAARIDAM
jgi:hypothetical protein